MGRRAKSIIGMLIVASVAFAGTTASAGAAVWKDNGVNITQFFQLDMTGLEVVELPPFAGSFVCELRVTMTSGGGSTATVTKWELKTCVGTDDLAQCKLTSYEAKNLPWAVTVNAADLSIASKVLIRNFSDCPIVQVESPAVTLTATPDSQSSIKELQFVNAAKTRHGTLVIDAPNSGTYGIG